MVLITVLKISLLKYLKPGQQQFTIIYLIHLLPLGHSLNCYSMMTMFIMFMMIIMPIFF